MRQNIKLSTASSCLSLALSMMYCTAVLSYVNAVFLGVYPLRYLAYFYLISAALFIAATGLTASYFTHQSRNATKIALLFCMVIIGCAWYWNSTMVLIPWYPFALCAFLLTSGKFLMQTYWNIASQMLHIREFKKNSNILGGSIAAGGILMGLLGPLIIGKYNVVGLLLAIVIFLLINLLLLHIIILPNATDETGPLTASATRQPFHYQYSLQKLLMFFALATLIFSTLVDYMFKYQMKISFEADKIAIYSSRLAALSYTFTLLLEFFYVKKILQKFGLRAFMLQVPFVFIALALIVAFKPNLITISLLWVIYNVANLSVLDLAFQLLGNALPAQIRGISRLKAKGIGLLFGSIISAGLVFFLSNKANPLAISLSFALSMALFIVLIQRSVKAYNQSLERNLREHHILDFEDLALTENADQWNETVQKCFDSNDIAVKLIGYELLRKKHPISDEMIDKRSQDLQDNNPTLRIEAAKILALNMNEKYFTKLSDRLAVESDPEVIWWIFQAFMNWRKEAVLSIAKMYSNADEELVQAGRISVLIKFGNITEVILALNYLVMMINSQDPMVRMGATRILSLFDLQSSVDSLSDLMVDPNLHVSITAIQSALDHPKKDYIAPLIQQMGVKNVTYYARKAISTYGIDIIPVLVAHIGSINNPVFHRAAIHCIASIQDEIAEKTLGQLMSYDNTSIRNYTVKAIAYRALTIEFTEKFSQVINKQLQEEKSHIAYYKQLLSLNLTAFERQEIKALIYSAAYRVLYLFSIDAPQKLMPIVSLILEAMVQSDFSNFFQEKIELLDTHLRDSHNRLFLLQLFDESTVATVDSTILLSRDKLGPWLSTVFSIKSLIHEGAHMHDLEKLVILRGCDLFKNLPADILLLLAERLEVVLIPKETILFKEGDIPGDLYIVAEGDIDIVHGKQLITSKKKFDFIGELSILDDKPRTATAVAATDVVVLKMSKIEYDRILDDFPDILRTIAQTLLGYLRQYQS
jgi:HEAT repeat protein